MNEHNDKTKGGRYVRDANGDRHLADESTAPALGKTEKAKADAAKAAVKPDTRKAATAAKE